MSRIGENPITIEEGVSVVLDGNRVDVTGPNGTLTLQLPEILKIEQKENELLVTRSNDDKFSKSIHGTYRMIIANAIHGVKEMFVKDLELVGVGYRAKMEGTTLVLSLGWNHPVKIEQPEGIKIEVPSETKVSISGADKQQVGEFSAKVRGLRKPEPYKGKGIRYSGEYVRRKSSKSAVKA